MKRKNGWQYQSIESLEECDYGNPTTASTALVEKCLSYVKLPVNTLNVEQLRLLIGQEIGLLYLIPLALDELNKNILAEGDMYEGDLLKNITSVPPAFWINNRELYEEVKLLLEVNSQKISEAGINITSFPNL